MRCCALYKERTISKSTAIVLAPDPEIHLTTQGNLDLCLKSSLRSRVFQMCSSLMDLSGMYEKLKHFLSSSPPQGGHTQGIPSVQHYWELFTKQHVRKCKGWSLHGDTQHKKMSSKHGAGLRAQTQGLALRLPNTYNVITHHSPCHQQARPAQARNRGSAEKTSLWWVCNSPELILPQHSTLI